MKQEIDYLKEKGVEMNFEKAVYSINKGYGVQVLVERKHLHQKECCLKKHGHTGYKNGSEEVKLHFEKGELKAVNEDI